jgi:Mn2+/Fe2+ NRAMP family transporter
MVGDNDAGAFGTYTQAGHNYGTTPLWTLLSPVLYVNQEIVVRLGAVTGVSGARIGRFVAREPPPPRRERGRALAAA